MSDAVPSRAAAALSPGFPLAPAHGGKVLLHPFTPRRLLLLHSAHCPLFEDPSEICGLPLAWAATLRIMAEDNPAELAFEMALDGPAAFVAASADWFEGFRPALCVDDLGAAAMAIKAEWMRVNDLDRPDAPAERSGSAMGEACAPAMASSPSSSDSPSPNGDGASDAPSTAPSAP